MDLPTDLGAASVLLLEASGVYRHQGLMEKWEACMNAANTLADHAARLRAGRSEKVQRASRGRK